MNKEEFIEKYEEVLNNGYCECNELNCLDNNAPRKILKIMKKQKEEIERLKEELEKLNAELRRYKSIVYLCEKVKDCDKE